MDEAEDEGVSLFQSYLFEDFVDFSGINGSTVILIEDVEGILKLLIIFGGESVLPGGGAGCLGGWGGSWLTCSAHKICNLYNKRAKSNKF